jgi:geranylgeranyl diphosphate synthase type II
MIDPKEYLQEVQKDVDAVLDRLLPTATTIPSRLHEAMRYSVFAGGKRLRPALCIASAETFGGKRENALIAAAALEALHTYTLIHDDLPAMDNDDMRRGKPSCHKAFDEATAILAGDALLTAVFEWLGSTGNSRFVTELAHATGSVGTVGGQSDDMQSKGKALPKEDILFIHERKTANLFEVSCRLGAISAGGSDMDIDAVGTWGKSLGVAFQLLDDVCDNDAVTMDSFSREGALAVAKEYQERAGHTLAKMSADTQVLNAVATSVISSFGL